jgi:Ti-type conjugative transfer relaxase TraA
MLPDISKGKGISGAVRYVLGQGRGHGNDWQPGQQSRVAWIGGQGFGFNIESREDAELARRVMEFAALNQTSRTKPCERDALHMSLSWHPDELPTREQMEQAAHDALKALGMEDARAIFVAHNDTDHAHLHIVASRINPETGRAFSDTNDWKKINEWALEYERQSGIIRCQRRETVDPHDHEKVLEAMTADRSTFTRNDLERLLGRAIVSRVERSEMADVILARPEIIGLRETADASVTRYTTREVLVTEREVLLDARTLHKATAHGIMDHIRYDVLARHGHLDDEQRAAFAHATETNGFALIAGEAGTGKSTTIEAVREAYEAAGHRVIGLSWTNAVVQDMKRDGFTQASTIASELKRLETGSALWNSRTVLIVDEAAMLSTKHLAELTARARESGAKLILVGDDKQLASIERGGMFGALRQEHGAAELHQVRRVADAEQKRAFNRMHAGDFETALEVFERKGSIHWSLTQDAARDALVSKYAGDSIGKSGGKRFVFAYTNAEVDAINRDIRAVRKERGELGVDHILKTKDGPQAFAAGDRIQFTGNARRKSLRDLGFTNGVVGTVRDIDGLRMTVELDGKKNGKPRMVSFTVGDNTQAGQFNTFRHGYAGTIYKGQGRTLDQTYLYHSKHMRSASSYVALTRHREHTTVFVARETTADIRQLARQMARIDDRRAAAQFHHEEVLTNERAQPSAERQKPNDERQRKIDEVIQRMKQQRERERDHDRER